MVCLSQILTFYLIFFLYYLGPLLSALIGRRSYGRIETQFAQVKLLEQLENK